MKCRNCRERMKVTLGNTEIEIEDAYIKIINLPVLVYPNCENQVVHDVLIKRALNYVYLYGAQNNIIDFGICEQKENENTIITMHTLGIL